MAKKPNYKPSEVNGPSIYHLKNQTVYYDFLTKNGYVLTSGDLNAYSLYSNRWIIGLMALIITYMIWNNLFISFVSCAGIGIVLEAWYRFKIMPELYTIENFQRPYKNNIIYTFAANASMGMLIAFLVFSLIIIVATIVVLFNAEPGTDLGSVILMFIVVLVIMVMCIAAIVVKAKRSNNH